MNETSSSPRITIRVPGNWSHPRELVERLQGGYSLRPDVLVTPDGAEMEFTPMPADEQFPQIFQTACRRPPSREELAVLAGYTVNIGLSAAGGSMESALAMMKAGAAIVRAGGAG